ncbi:hypothetical protein C1645_584317 [Glomus cerebriforme]|uniref:Uncharacterized protein n=1 Tax=Glomus cerebriforme TaxID=658196 RepID=A0A397SDP0_9GLOM|nr:hypothetical protein C1645_584317 [Glomus cerebriforme]
MSTTTTNNQRTNSSIQGRSSKGSSFSNFTRWVKVAILRKSKKNNSSNSNERSIKRVSNSRRAPLRRSASAGKRRKSRKPNRRSKLFFNLNINSVNEISIINNDDNLNDNNEKYDNNNDNSDNNNNNNYSNNNDDWVNYETSNKDELIIIPNINSTEMKSDDDVCEISVSMTDKDQKVSTSSSTSDCSSDDSRDDYLENTRIIKGSVEHFAYVRTLRKLRKDRQRQMNQVVLLNNILEKVSFPSKLSDKIQQELIHFKTRVYELNRSKRNSIIKVNDINGRLPYYSFNNSTSTSSLCPSSLMNKKLSEIMAEVHPTSPITMKYRPTYASSKVVTIFDEELNQLVVKDLPMSRRKRRLSDLSNILRSTSTSTTTSTNSSQSSLVTLTDDVEQNKYSTLITKEPDTYLSNHLIIRNNNDNDDEGGDGEDDVPLFVLKEQFRYSGRGYGILKNNFSSLEENGSRVTLAV